MWINLLLACAIVAGFLAICLVIKFLWAVFSPVDNGNNEIVTSDGTMFGYGKVRRVKNTRHYANWH